MLIVHPLWCKQINISKGDQLISIFQINSGTSVLTIYEVKYATFLWENSFNTVWIYVTESQIKGELQSKTISV